MVYRPMPGEGSSAGPGAGETGETGAAGSLAGVASVLLCRAAEKRFLAGAGILTGAAGNTTFIKNWLSALLASLV